MKIVPVRESVGMFLAHDMTQIIPGEFRGAAFKKGHVVQEEDIPRLLNMGKEYVAIIEFDDGTIHEDDAAQRLGKAASGTGVEYVGASEGKVLINATCDGLLKVNVFILQKINELGEMMLATLHTDIVVKKGTQVAATRIIPLSIENEKLVEMETLCKKHGPIVEVLSLKRFNVGIVTTGNEVFCGRIEDKFGAVIKNKFAELGSTVVKQVFARDDSDMIAKSILDLIEEGADIITVTGGMSVDPDDVTPEGIAKTGAKFVSYGAPTLPGAMFLISYLRDIPILGLPGCIMYSYRTIFDLVVPKLMAGERLTAKDISKLGHGGLCSTCEECHYPNCGFGKG